MIFYVLAQLNFKHRVAGADAMALLMRGIG
jgi:hypothetical protein